MIVIEKDNIKDAYISIIENLLSQKEIINGTKELNNACVIINHPTSKDINFGKRNISLTYLIEELKWYWSGDNKCEDIGKYASMWLKLSDDGITNNSAYGYILFNKYNYNQLEQVIDVLKKDKYSRRAVLNISDPTINRLTTKDMQCTIAIQFLIRNNKLEETVYMRSNDVYFGFPYDYIFFVSLGEYVAKKLGIEFSKYIHHATSLHMYERDFDKFDVMYEDERTFNEMENIINENYKN